MEVATAEGSREPPQVSVICTARNAAPTIEATIRSILAQDFQGWEMIVVDDGSTDGTVDIVNRLAETDPRIRLIATAGVGRGRALNVALATTRADLVANIDADDESQRYRLRYQVEAMQHDPELAVLATGTVTVRDLNSAVWPPIDPGAPCAVEDVTAALPISNPVCHSSAMMRKAAIIGLDGYDEAVLTEDYDLWVRCAAAGLRIGRLELPLTAKRIHPGQHFLNSPRLRYLLAGFRVKARAMRAAGLGHYLPVVAALLLARLLLPLGVRLRLRTLRISWTLRRNQR